MWLQSQSEYHQRRQVAQGPTDDEHGRFLTHGRSDHLLQLLYRRILALGIVTQLGVVNSNQHLFGRKGMRVAA